MEAIEAQLKAIREEEARLMKLRQKELMKKRLINCETVQASLLYVVKLQGVIHMISYHKTMKGAVAACTAFNLRQGDLDPIAVVVPRAFLPAEMLELAGDASDLLKE